MIKYFSLFSGIGAFEKALSNLNIDFDLLGYSEFDSYASQSYSLIHKISENKNLWDITKIDETKLSTNIDLVTYGFPCQDISLAGKQKGLFGEDGEKTRSGLFFDALRIITHTQPKVAIAENVKNLLSKKFEDQFHIVLQSLEEAGYNNYFQIVNSKDFGIPQTRDRVFIISIRKDLDKGNFKFPTPYELTLRLKDILEESVDEKYYLSDERLGMIYKWKAQQRPLTRILGRESISPTLTARGAGEYHSGMILYSDKYENVTNYELRMDKPNHIERIRYFTEKECFRLMGFDDEDFKAVVNTIPSRQLYKQAGNSIVVDVAEELLCMLFDEEGNLFF